MSKEVGARIREARRNAGLSQAALAAKTEGISPSVLGKAERGEKELSPEKLQALADALEVSLETLTGEAAADAPEAAEATEAAEAPEAEEAPEAAEAAEEPVEMTEDEKEVVELFKSADTDTQNAAISTLKEGKISGSGLMLTLSGLLGGQGGDGSKKLMSAVLKLVGSQGGDVALKLASALTKLTGGQAGESAEKNPLDAVMKMVGGIMSKK